MKIVHIVHSLRGGGIQNFLLSLASEQVKTGDKVTIIVIDKFDSEYCSNLEKILLTHKVNVYRLNKVRGNKLSLLKAIYRCVRIICNINPDIVNTHSGIGHLYGGIATLITSIPQVVTVHNAPEKWSKALSLLCKNKPIIFCSQAAYELREQESPLMTAIDNGISRDIVHSKEIIDLRTEYKLKKDDKIIVLVGSLRPQKNYIFIKDIVNLMENDSYHFFICGGGAAKECIDEIEVLKQCNNIHFLGLRNDVSAIENAADLFLSCAKFEGLPIAVLEAYFNGIPCVLSPIEQHMKISDVDYVWIPKKFTATEFVNSIRQALKEQKLEHNLIYEKRKKQIAYYSIKRAAQEYKTFYEKILN